MIGCHDDTFLRMYFTDDASDASAHWKAIANLVSRIHGVEDFRLNDIPVSFEEIEGQLARSCGASATVDKLIDGDPELDSVDVALISRSLQERCVRVDVRFPSSLQDDPVAMCRDVVLTHPAVGKLYLAIYANWRYFLIQNTGSVNLLCSLGVPLNEFSVEYDEDVDLEIVDTFANPGREMSRNGFAEVVGSQIWIGSEFATRTGNSWAAAAAFPWCVVTELEHCVVQLSAWPEPFTEWLGDQKERQDALRKALFPNTWDEPWTPPGFA